MLSNLINRRSKGLSLLAIISASIGLSLIILSVQLYQDWNQLNQADTSYIIVNKPVNFLSTLGLKSGFSQEEITDIKQQDWALSVGSFQSNQFRVSLGSNRLGFRTDAFFESVPDEFLDLDVSGWQKYEKGDVIPIVLSSDYLALYNFGFAPSQGLPQFTPGTINKVTLDVTIQGAFKTGTYKGRIVGFSQRLNSIIVPESFLQQANKEYGTNDDLAQASRLIIRTEDSQLESIKDYGQAKGWEFQSNKVFGERTTTLVQRAILIILFFGFLVFILTILVFYLNYQLIIEQQTPTIRILFTQGYHIKELSRMFDRNNLVFVLLTGCLSLVLVQVFHIYLSSQLRAAGFEISQWLGLPTIVSLILLSLIIYGVIRIMIQRTLLSKYQ